MKRYRLDLKKPRQLTTEEARRLDAMPIDYSDIPPLGDEFLLRTAMESQYPRRRTVSTASPKKNSRTRGGLKPTT